MSNDAEAGRNPATDGHLRRAELLADLACYADAVTEVRYAVALDPADPVPRVMLGRVRLLAEEPLEALREVDELLAVAPGTVPALVVRGFALADLGRYAEAARTADELLAVAPADAYAQRSAAAILGESRNGQPALDAAWRGIELAPEEPQAHLVLGLISARLELFDLAERAYREALRLDPDLAGAGNDTGVSRLERRRYARQLAWLAEDTAIATGQLDSPRTIHHALRRLVMVGAGYLIVAVLVTAVLAPGGGVPSRAVAVLAAVVGGVFVWSGIARMPGPPGAVPAALMRADRTLAVGAYALSVAFALLLLYALVPGPWPLVLSLAAAALAEFAILHRP